MKYRNSDNMSPPPGEVFILSGEEEDSVFEEERQEGARTTNTLVQLLKVARLVVMWKYIVNVTMYHVVPL